MRAKTKRSSWIGLVAVLVVVVAAGLNSGLNGSEASHLLTSISPRKMADSLHAVITAQRQVYVRELVSRTVTEKEKGDADWQETGLPVHADMVRMVSRNIQQHGAEFSFVLRSLWPIQPAHGPQTRVEQLGLEFVARHPETNYYSEEMLGGRRYFTAVYPDRAVFASCVECHTRHPASPRRDYAVGDVMGGLVVRIPLEF
jgi:hypothetical protein